MNENVQRISNLFEGLHRKSVKENNDVVFQLEKEDQPQYLIDEWHKVFREYNINHEFALMADTKSIRMICGVQPDGTYEKYSVISFLRLFEMGPEKHITWCFFIAPRHISAGELPVHSVQCEHHHKVEPVLQYQHFRFARHLTDEE